MAQKNPSQEPRKEGEALRTLKSIEALLAKLVDLETERLHPDIFGK